MTVTLAPEMHQSSLAYMQRWFVSKQRLAEMAGVSEGVLDELVAAGAAPGVIYSYHPDHGWWSALARYKGEATPAPFPGGEGWWSPGAAWWLRRAVFAMRNGLSAMQAAQANEAHFVSDFCARLGAAPYAAYGLADCLREDRTVCVDAAAARASSEWADWASGGFAVCLPVFSAERCLAKECLAARLKAALDANAPESDRLDDQALFDLTEALAALMLPFSPWERPSGTPGVVIDPVLKMLELGVDD